MPASADLSRPIVERRAGALSVIVAPSTVLVLMALTLLLLLTPLWVHGAISLSGAGGSLATPEQALRLSDQTVAELLFGPGTFTFAGPDGGSFYTAAEAAHMRDVRGVLFAFLTLALVAAVVIGLSFARRRSEAATWRAVARGGAALAVGLVVAGIIGALAFGLAFELFHRLLFFGGNWAFPPDSNLIKLYPFSFWQLSAGAFAVLGIAGGFVAWLIGRRGAARAEAVARRMGR